MSKRILVVEDDALLRRGMAMLFGIAGHEAIEAGTMKEAIDLLAEGPSHVVLDAYLPDGVDTTLLKLVKGCGVAQLYGATHADETFLGLMLEGGGRVYDVVTYDGSHRTIEAYGTCTRSPSRWPT